MKNTHFRLLAIIIGGIAELFFLGAFIIAAFFESTPEELAAIGEIIPVIILLIIAFIGYIGAIFMEDKWELYGGFTLMIVGVILILYLVFTASRNGVSVGLIYGLPFIVPGLLFILHYRKNMLYSIK